MTLGRHYNKANQAKRCSGRILERVLDYKIEATSWECLRAVMYKKDSNLSGGYKKWDDMFALVRMVYPASQ